MSLPRIAEVEHADWPTLKRMAGELELNPKGRSAVVRLRVLDHVRRRTRAEPWKPTPGHVAPLLLRLGFAEDAGRLWESTIRLDAPAPWVGLGAALLATGDRTEGLKAFDRAAQMGDASAHLHRALALLGAGDASSAVRACDAYLAARPGDARGMALKASALARGGWLDEAVSVLREFLESRPGAREAWRGIGALLLRSGRPDDAAKAFREAVRADAKDLDALINEGAALHLAGRIREATGAYREALEADGARADALNDLGVLYLRSGRSRSAVVNLERAAKHLGTRRVLLNLARVLETERRRSDALDAYRRVLKGYPKDSEALAGIRRLDAAPKKGAPVRAPRVAKRSKPAEHGKHPPRKRRPSSSRSVRKVARRAPESRKRPRSKGKAHRRR